MTTSKASGGTLKKLATVFKNVRFMAIVFLAAIPAKIILTGFLYFIVPLYLFSLGSSTAETGRIMMIYPVIVIALGPAASWTADKLGSMMERIGSVLGPIIAATFVAIFGYEQAIMFMGIIISGSAILFLAVFAMTAGKSGAAESSGG